MPKKIFLFIALIATIIPAIFTIQQAGGWGSWQGVLPKGTADSFYYYARIHEVLDGHPMIGNPYVYEYRDNFPPTFFISDAVSAVPMLLGVPFNLAVVLNLFVWSFVFLILSFNLFKLLKMPEWWSLLWSIFLYVSSYSFMLRPSGMQIAYPLFLLFLIALIKFFYEPFLRRRMVWLSVVSALTFYAYSYLAYAVFLTLAFTAFWFLFTRRFKELRVLVGVAFLTGLLLVPFIVFTLIQIKDPYYLETFARIGLVFTRVPSIEAFFFGRWIVIGLAALGILWVFFPATDEDGRHRRIFWSVTGAGLFAGLILNVLTGVELELAAHVGRFVALWMVLLLCAGLYECYVSRVLRTNRTKYALVVTLVFLIVLSAGVMRNASRRLGFFDFNNRPGYNFADTQTYAAPLKWLSQNAPEQTVVWANSSISEHIAITTQHYPLFFQGAILHSISQKELEDRYLLSKSFEDVTSEDMKRDFGLYGGTLAIPDEEYFKNMAERFEIIRKNQIELVQKFNVKYLIVDRTRDHLESISVEKSIYDDGRFLIFKVI